MADPKYPVRTVDRALEIVEIIRELDGAGVSEIAGRVDIGKSAVHNHLNTLVNKEYLVKEDGEYQIGLAFLGLGAYARNRTRIYDTARHEIDSLAAETSELANLLVEKNGKGVYLYQAEGENAVDLDTYEGAQVPLHSTGLGKSILAFRPREEVEEIIDRHGLPRITEQTITDREELFADLETIRERKYAIDEGERVNGLCCIAAPITNNDDRSIGAISVACPVHRISDERFYEELPSDVLGAANVIELEYNYS